ncbi:MAG: hypothetical protein KJ064_17990 [Anaerolineae bacterium]|nr:hypothetical protein [Anaerolineae bacterium]
MKRIIFLLPLFLLILPPPSSAQTSDAIALAYVMNDSVWLADIEGTPIINTGPQIQPKQGAYLFWSPDGALLYTATREGLFVTSAQGGAANRLPGEFGLTVTLARQGSVIYNLDVENPQEIAENIVGFPLRETNMSNMQGGRGRMLATLGEYQTGTTEAYVSHAAAKYIRDGGLPGAGRPHLWSTYGGSLFYSCCFPNEGLGVLDVTTGDNYIYDASFIPGPAALNSTASRLVGPTTDGLIRTIDLISAGSRDYILDIPFSPFDIERMTWSSDDSAIYFVTRGIPADPLQLLPTVTYPADTRSFYGQLWKLNLITGRIDEITDFGDIYGVSSIAATRDYIFVVVVERNQALIQALNTGQLPPDISPTDPALNNYIPRTLLWRVDVNTGDTFALGENVWGLAARPG